MTKKGGGKRGVGHEGCFVETKAEISQEKSQEERRSFSQEGWREVWSEPRKS